MSSSRGGQGGASLPSSSETSSSLPDLAFDYRRALLRIRTAFIRAAAAGVTLRGGLHALSTAVYLLGKLRRPAKPLKRGLSWAEAIKDTAKYTAFLGIMGAVYVMVDEGLLALFGKDRTSPWRALVAGGIAGQMLRLTGSETRHHSLATYVLLRGATLLLRAANKPGATSPLVRRLLAPTRMQHGDTVLMCISASQIVYSFVMMPSTLPRSYVRFINKQAAKEGWVFQAVREQALRNWYGLGPGRLQLLQGTPFSSLESKTPCGFWHPGQSCQAHAISVIPSAYLRALGVYLPMYLVPAVLVHRQSLIKMPLAIWPKLAVGVARSSLFLTLYISVGFAAVCAAINAAGSVSGPLIASSVWIGGLATLLEKKSRRMELATYCSSRAIESFSRCLLEWGVVDAALLPARLDVLLFSVGCAAIMHCYSGDHGRHRDVFHSKYLNVLDFIFGNAGMQTGSIVHLPSNRDILTVAARHIRTYSRGSLADLDRSSSTASLQAGPHLAGGGRPTKERREHGSSNALNMKELMAGSGGGAAMHVTVREAAPAAGEASGRRAAGAAEAPGRPGPSASLLRRDATASAGLVDGRPPRLQPSSSASPMRRSATEPSFVRSGMESRVHGTERGIRSVAGELTGEASFAGACKPPLSPVREEASATMAASFAEPLPQVSAAALSGAASEFRFGAAGPPAR